MRECSVYKLGVRKQVLVEEEFERERVLEGGEHVEETAEKLNRMQIDLKRNLRVEYAPELT